MQVLKHCLLKVTHALQQLPPSNIKLWQDVASDNIISTLFARKVSLPFPCKPSCKPKCGPLCSAQNTVGCVMVLLVAAVHDTLHDLLRHLKLLLCCGKAQNGLSLQSRQKGSAKLKRPGGSPAGRALQLGGSLAAVSMRKRDLPFRHLIQAPLQAYRF